MMNNPRALERMMRSNETDDAHLALQLFLSETANTQFPGQDPRPKEKAGRTLAIFEVLPHRYPEKLSREHARLIENLLPRMESFLGTSFFQLSICFLVLINWQSNAYVNSRNSLATCIGNPLAIGDPKSGQLAIVRVLLEEEPLLDSLLIFTPERLARALIPPENWAGFDRQFGIFLRLFSATTRELREMFAERSEFQIGSTSNRLSPLERYPVVRIGEKAGLSELIVPNVAHFLKSFSAVIDYALLGEFGDQYSQLRGALLELYVRCLVEARLPHLIVIPEIPYGREERRGPDLTLIDRDLGRIILVEVKGRRIRLSTRLNVTREELRENLGDAHEALRKLPRKLADLYRRLPEYAGYQEAIDATRGSTPICIAILSEGVYSMGELARELGTRPDDPLHNYPFPY